MDADGGSGTVAQAVARSLKRHGVTHIFGIPGGGSSLDVIDAAAQQGIAFVLTRGETPAVFMAAAAAEITGRPSAALTTKGPGVANAANGLAHASLDRAPVILLADGFDAAQAYMSHQVFDQTAMVAPVTKAQSCARSADVEAETDGLLATALAYPRGPVYLEFTAKRAEMPAPSGVPGPAATAAPLAPDLLERARQLLAAARKPVIIAGLQAGEPAAAAALQRLARALRCPVFPTYKAKGVLPDADPLVVGCYVGGAGEEPAIRAGDLILLYGADPVEFALQPWRYKAPVLELTRHRFDRHYVAPVVSVIGDLAAAADALAPAPSGWTPAEIAAARSALREILAVRGGGPITPQHVIEAAVAAAPDGARIAVDAGAHMVPVMAFWNATRPGDALISNGLATMGFSLPAAIAASLVDPARRVIAFTGDGGLMMCAGELGTAAQNRCNLTVVVFNDAALSMIALKQQRRQMPSRGVEFSPSDFAAVARGFGCAGFRAETLAELGPALTAALATDGPSLVDVVTDPSGYLEQVKALRG